MALTSHLLLVLLGMSYLVNQAAAVDGSLVDGLSLVQQRAQLAPEARLAPDSSSLATILAESFHAGPHEQEEIIGKVVGKVGEERLQQFWEKLIEIGQAPNVSRAQRGLLLLQESDKVMGAAEGKLREFLYSPTTWLMARSEPSSCGLTFIALAADIGDFTVSIAYVVGAKCSKPLLCTASWMDILRALGYTLRDLTAYRSYCAESVSTGTLCLASKFGGAGEAMGILHSSFSAGYHCKSGNDGGAAVSGEVFGVDARKFMCGFDISRGSVYALLGIYRAGYWWWLRGSHREVDTQKDGNEGPSNEDTEVMKLVRHELEIGWSGPTYAFMAIGGFAWVMNSIAAGIANCQGDKNAVTSAVSSACAKEVSELAAYISQSLGNFNNYLDYCRDYYEKNEQREEAGNEVDFRRMVTEKWETDWQSALEAAGTDLALDDQLDLADELFVPEVAEMVKDRVRKSVVSPPESENSISGRRLSAHELNKVANRVRKSIILSTPQQDRSQRLSIYKPPSSTGTNKGDSTISSGVNLGDWFNFDLD